MSDKESENEYIIMAFTVINATLQECLYSILVIIDDTCLLYFWKNYRNFMILMFSGKTGISKWMNGQSRALFTLSMLFLHFMTRVKAQWKSNYSRMFSCCVSDDSCSFLGNCEWIYRKNDLPASQMIVSCHYCQPQSCDFNFLICLLKVHKTWQKRDSNSDHQQRVTDCGALCSTYPFLFREQLCLVTLIPRKPLTLFFVAMLYSLECGGLNYGGDWRQSRAFDVCERPKISWTV